MAKYVYPALFEPNELGGFCVEFPDIIGAVTQGDDLAEAIENAQDVLCLMLYNHELGKIQKQVSPPTPINDLNIPAGGFVNLISCDTNYYKRYFANKMINKTVTIPASLNYEAEQAGINFSQVLRDGLEKVLKTV